MIRSKVFIVLAALLLSVANLSAQFSLEEWKSYTTLSIVRNASIDSRGRIWAATSGGVYIYNRTDDSYITLRDELLSTDISKIFCIIPEKLVLVGTGDGVVEIISEDLDITHITSIRDENFPNPEIIDFAVNGNLLYIAGGFGLTVFDIDERIFITTVKNFEGLGSNPIINKILIKNNEIWLATSQGIVKTSLSKPIEVPSNWERMDDKNNFAVTSIISDEDRIFVASDKEIYEYQDTSLNSIHENTYTINDLYSEDEELIFSNDFGVYSINKKIIFENYEKPITGFSIYGMDTLLYFRKGGLGLLNSDNIKILLPNSPSGNTFSDLTISKEGNLWCASDNMDEPTGIMMFDGEKWYNYQKENYPVIKSDRYYRITPHFDGRLIASNYSDGALIIDPGEEVEFTSITEPFASIPGGWIVTGQSAVDNNGVIWIVNYGGESPGPILIAIDEDNNTYTFNNKFQANQRYFVSLAIDFNQTKWLGSDEAAKGLMYINNRGTLDDATDDEVGILTKSQYSNLVSNVQNALAVDQNGMLWIGTPDGVSVIINPSAVVTGSTPIVRSLERLLGSLSVNDIMVDPQNNKWLATSSGLWIVDPDGVEVIAQYDESNSPLTTNKILSVTLNKSTGQAYIGTGSGLFSAKSLSIEPLTDYDIKCYPQPFNPQLDEELVIDGLASNSDIRIMTISGELVQKLKTSSRKTVWDGRNRFGEYVKSGIYMVVTSSEGSSTSSVAKIAIINK